MLPDVLQLICRVTQVFEALGIAYYIGGSVASGQYGLPRSTRDVDFIADLREKQVAAFVVALENDFYVDSNAVLRAVRGLGNFDLIHFETVYKVDIFVAGRDEWAQAKLSRRQAKRLAAEPDAPLAFVSSAEDTVLQKLRWFQKGGGVSERQWDDVLGVLKVQAGALDYPYLQRWAAELGIAELLQNAMVDAGLTPDTAAETH
ncbi:MAG: hypothetical protein HYR56_03095 [Acidobacteria bacterium]|nr:hypothetical protein [Acidobacteriota bacterium]MBI3423555.1 hypothetical protein [Acidobacteriota bacterium]